MPRVSHFREERHSLDDRTLDELRPAAQNPVEPASVALGHVHGTRDSSHLPGVVLRCCCHWTTKNLYLTKVKLVSNRCGISLLTGMEDGEIAVSEGHAVLEQHPEPSLDVPVATSVQCSFDRSAPTLCAAGKEFQRVPENFVKGAKWSWASVGRRAHGAGRRMGPASLQRVKMVSCGCLRRENVFPRF